MASLSAQTESVPAIAAHVQRHQAGLRRYLRFLGARADLADDLVQETFVRAFTTGFEWRSDAASGAWLRKTARRLFLTELRRGSRPAATATVDELAAIWEEQCDDGAEELLAALRACLAELKERHLHALRLRYGHDESVATVGERLGLGASGADSLLTRIRGALRRCIGARTGR